MPSFMAHSTAQLRATWERLDAAQRWVIASVPLAAAGALISVLAFAAGGRERVAWTGTGAELQVAVGALDGRVGYRIEEGRLVVAADDLQRARRLLWSAGVAAEDASSVDDHAGREGDVARALERAAAQQLERFQHVVEARVAFAAPVVVGDAARAQVGLRLVRGADFRELAPVAASTASAALGVPVDAVSVANLTTAELWSAGGDRLGSADAAEEFLRMQERRTRQLTAVAQSILDALYPGKAIARVHVELDPEMRTVLDRSASDNPVLLRSSTNKEETRSPAERDPRAVPEIGTEVFSRPTESSQLRENEYSPESFVETSTKHLAPAVRAVGVALFVDRQALGSTDTAALCRQIGVAVGWREGRDPAIEVHPVDLPEPPRHDPSAAAAAWAWYERHQPIVAGATGTALVLLFLVWMIRRATGPRAARVAPAGVAAAAGESASEGDSDARNSIEQAIDRDPAAITRALETWLQEQRP